MNVHTCAHTHTHTHSHRGLVPLAVTLVLISHTVYMCMNVHACAHTHDTHIHAHTHTHTHTHTRTDWACTTCSDFGLLFLTLYSQSMYMCKKTLAHCYVNSPYTIFVINTYTHTHTLTCAHTHAHAHTQTGLVTLAVTLGSYFSHYLYKAYITARKCTVCSLVYCTHTNRYSSALDTWAVFHTSRMRRLYTSQNEHFAYTYDIAVCIWIRYIRHHLSAYFR